MMKPFSDNKPILSSSMQQAQHPTEEPTEPNRHIPEREPHRPTEIPTEPNRHIPEREPHRPTEIPTEPNPNIPEFPITK